MRISNIKNNQKITLKPVQSYTKKVLKKAKTSALSPGGKVSFIKTPLKYYVIGLAIPIPFASTAGFVYGMGVVIYNKMFKKADKDKTS